MFSEKCISRKTFPLFTSYLLLAATLICQNTSARADDIRIYYYTVTNQIINPGSPYPSLRTIHTYKYSLATPDTPDGSGSREIGVITTSTDSHGTTYDTYTQLFYWYAIPVGTYTEDNAPPNSPAGSSAATYRLRVNLYHTMNGVAYKTDFVDKHIQ